jgi:O-antigen/teichoic acid export membrane protein
MHQILLPLSAKYLNERNFGALNDLYQKSSITLFIVSGFIFLLIVLNINELYRIIPEEFSGGLFVVFIISITKLYDAILGSNNAILFNSDYYRMVLVMGVILVVLLVLLNMVFIPKFGINGSAIATFLAIFVYNTIKLIFVYRKFKIVAFTSNTLKIGALILANVLMFYFWEFPFNPFINIALKSTLIAVLYVFVIYRYNFSEDISAIIKRYLRLK